MIQGDFNAYTNTQHDFVLNDNSDHSVVNDVHYLCDNVLPRNNLDHKRTNNSGKLMLNLCKEAGLRILNGRTVGDFFGKQTCVNYNGCSLVDYTVVSQEIYSQIGLFQVLDFTYLSNHCPIVCSIFAQSCIEFSQQSRLYPLPGKFIWSDKAKSLYKKNIQSKEAARQLENFMKTDFNDSDIIVDSFNSILIDISKKSTKFVFKQTTKAKKRKIKKPWFTESCKELRNTVKNYEKLVK